jgi:hypothetical protein
MNLLKTNDYKNIFVSFFMDMMRKVGSETDFLKMKKQSKKGIIEHELYSDSKQFEKLFLKNDDSTDNNYQTNTDNKEQYSDESKISEYDYNFDNEPIEIYSSDEAEIINLPQYNTLDVVKDGKPILDMSKKELERLLTPVGKAVYNLNKKTSDKILRDYEPVNPEEGHIRRKQTGRPRGRPKKNEEINTPLYRCNICGETFRLGNWYNHKQTRLHQKFIKQTRKFNRMILGDN